MRCSSSGDPHNTMFSGKTSHPQGSGPFILAQSADKAFVVQTCHQAIGSGSVSINKALAIKTPQGVIKYTDGNWDVGSTGVSCTGGVCTFAGGEKVAAVGSSVWVEFPSSYCSKVSGLCGTFNPSANFADAYTNANGLITSVNGNPQWGTFQSDFVESFALDGTSSLFTASECPLPNPNNPPPLPLVPFAECPLLKAVAEAKCPRNSRYQYCIDDVGASCDLSWVTDAQVTVPGNMGGRPTPPPTPVPTPGCNWNTCGGMTSCGGEITCSSSGDPHMHMFFQNSAAIGTTTTGGHPQGNGAFVFAENLEDRKSVV